MDLIDATNTQLASTWLDAALDLGLDVEAPFLLRVGSTQLRCAALVRGFGHVHGTLVLHGGPDAWNRAMPTLDEAFQLGYALSWDSEENRYYERASFIWTLDDLGWAGEDDPPTWFRGEVISKELLQPDPATGLFRARSAPPSPDPAWKWAEERVLPLLTADEILAALVDEDWHVRATAALRLRLRADPDDGRTIPTLLTLLERDPHPEVRQTAAEQLANFRGDLAVVRGLTRAVDHDDEPDVRREARNSLALLSHPR